MVFGVPILKHSRVFNLVKELHSKQDCFYGWSGLNRV